MTVSQLSVTSVTDMCLSYSLYGLYRKRIVRNFKKLLWLCKRSVSDGIAFCYTCVLRGSLTCVCPILYGIVAQARFHVAKPHTA